MAAVPCLAHVDYYIAEACVPGGTQRNFDSYGYRIALLPDVAKELLCDPQTSGGLLVAVAPEGEAEFHVAANACGLQLAPIGRMIARQSFAVQIA